MNQKSLNKIQDLSPGLFITLVLLIYLIVLKLPFFKLFDSFFPLQVAKELGHLIHSLILISAALFLIRKLRLQKLAGIKLLSVKRPIFLLIPFVFPITLALPNLLTIDPPDIGPFYIVVSIIVWMLQAITEELVFRGLLQGYLFEKLYPRMQTMNIIMLVSALFAGMHIINLVRQSYVDVINQVIVAFYLGVFLGALMLKVKNVWLLGFIHGLINVTFGIDEILRIQPTIRIVNSTGEIIKTIIIYSLLLLPVLLIGIWIIKKHKESSVLIPDKPVSQLEASQ